MEADVVLVSIGRRPYTENLNLEAVGIEKDNKGRIIIDSEYRTSQPHIRCIGDVTFGAMLAHKAEEEGIAAAEYIKIRSRPRQLRSNSKCHLYASGSFLGRSNRTRSQRSRN